MSYDSHLPLERLNAIREADQEVFMWQKINELIVHLYRRGSDADST